MRRTTLGMTDADHPPHFVPAAGVFGAAWQLTRPRPAPSIRDQFEARFVANDRSTPKHRGKGAHRLRLVA